MTTTTETEPRAPESNAQMSADGNGDPSEKQAAIKQIASMLPEFNTAFIDRLADRLKEELDVRPDTEADDELAKNTSREIGERMNVQHIFGGWAVVIRNVLPMLQAVTCLTDTDRETTIDDQDQLAVDQMINFSQKELDALVEHLDLAADCDNPRFVTPSGHVWKLEAEAVLIEKPDDA